MLLEVVLCVLAAAPLLYLYGTWTYDYWKKRGVPFVKPLPFVGNMLGIVFLRESFGKFSMNIFREGNGQPVIGFFQFRKPQLLLRDTEVIKHVMVKEFSSFHDNSFKIDETLDPLLAKNPFFQKGERWKGVRSMLTPAFTIGKIKPQISLMTTASKDLVEYIEDQISKGNEDGIEAKELAAKFTTDVVATCALGIAGNSLKDENAELRRKGRDLMSPSTWNSFKFTLLFFIPALGKIIKARFMNLEISNFFRGIIKEVISYREENNVVCNDFLQMLIQIKNKGQVDDDDKSIVRVAGVNLEYTEEDIFAHVLTFFVDGFETSSITLSFILYELAIHPEEQAKLRMEVDSVLEKYKGQICHEALQEMVYLDNVVSECLRLHPPAPVTDRVCTKACELPLPDGKIIHLEKGSTLVIPIEALHKNPEYFPEPEKFDPERFSEERKNDIKRYSYLPFGEGPRQCLGMKFALTQIKIGTVAIVSKFEICKSPKTPVPVVLDRLSFFPVVKGGLWIDFTNRTEIS